MRRIVSVLLVMSFLLVGPVVFDEAVEYLVKNQKNPTESISGQMDTNPIDQIEKLRLTPRAEAFNFLWGILAPLLGAGVTQAMNPKWTDSWMSTVVSLSLKTPDDQILPALAPQTDQHAVLLRQGAKMSEVKLGVNGQPLKWVEVWFDGDETSKIRLEKPPFYFGTDYVSLNPKNQIFNTASPFWAPGRVINMNFRALGVRDEYVDGEHPGYCLLQIRMWDDQMFQRAEYDPAYRSFLKDLNGGPNFPVSAIPLPDGRVMYSTNPAKDLQQLSQSRGSGQGPQGLQITAYSKGQPVLPGSEIHQKFADRDSIFIDFQFGPATTGTAIRSLDAQGKQTFAKVVMNGKDRKLRSTGLVPGKYTIQVQAIGADNAKSDVFEYQLVLER